MRPILHSDGTACVQNDAEQMYYFVYHKLWGVLHIFIKTIIYAWVCFIAWLTSSNVKGWLTDVLISLLRYWGVWRASDNFTAFNSLTNCVNISISM